MKPTMPGWYWWRRPGWRWRCVEVQHRPEHGGALAAAAIGGWSRVDQAGAEEEWSGPLMPPPPDKPKIGTAEDPWAGSDDPDHRYLSKKYGGSR